MQKHTLFLFLLLFTIFSCTDNKQIELAESAAAEVKSQFVPDRRVDIFDTDIEKTKDGLVIKGETNIPAAKKLLLQKITAINPNFIDSIQILPAADLGGETYGVVRLSVCNIRSKPKHSAELATQSTLGSSLRIYKKEGDWYYVQTPDDYLGWLDKDGFTLMDKTTYDAWMQEEKVIVTAEMAKATIGADLASATVSDLLPGNILAKRGVEGDFEKVAFPDGREAFIPRRFRTDLSAWLENTKPDTSRIFHIAKRMMGSPYLWGGTSSKGMDCSGYTKQIFFENGILLPRDASQQVRVGEEIKTDTTLVNLLSGDLLFFGRKATAEKKERIWHVAIYLGDGKIIHSAGNVKIQSLRRGDEDFAEDRLETFVRAKRILGSEGKNDVKWLKETNFY
ncbi:MAG: cell wall-associated NlpC family hydrolase [Saprospiraceae bacterium]|jgi:cell wall-associated NlpC family hydrolase